MATQVFDAALNIFPVNVDEGFDSHGCFPQ